MDQTDLFVHSHTRRDDPMSSRQAAHFIAGSVSNLQRLVYEYVRNHRGCTDREMVDALRREHGGSESTYRTRRAELVDMGVIEPLGYIEMNSRKHQTWTVTAHAFR